MLKFEQYWKANKYMIYRVISQYSNQYNFFDLQSAAKLGLMMAIRTYDKSKGCHFSTWLFWKLRKECQNVKNQEYITSCSSVTRKKCPVESKIPYEYCDFEFTKESDGSELINDFFETFKQYKQYKRLFYDRYIMEMRKNRLEKKYRISSRKELNKILTLLTEEFKQWYLINFKGTSSIPSSDSSIVSDSSSSSDSSGILEVMEAI